MVNHANQRDNTALAHLGAVVVDVLVAHGQASRAASQTVTPTEDDARILPPPERRLRELFEDLQLQPGLLLGAGIAPKELPSIGAGSMQAVLGVAWKFRHGGLLTRRPRPLDEWLRIPNGRPDLSTVLQEFCSMFKIKYSVDYLEHGSDHDRKFTAVFRFTDDTQVVEVRGPSASGKTHAKLLASEMVLAVVEGQQHSHHDQRLYRFLLRNQIAGAASTDARRCTLRGWLGVSYLASGDIPAFETWAKKVEEAAGPLEPDDLARLRSYFERCLVITRRGNLPLLRTTLTETTEWIQNLPEYADRSDVRRASEWASFRAVAATLGAITATEQSSLRELISNWYESAIGSLDVHLSSDLLDEDQDDLSPTRAAAISALLEAASDATGERHRLQVAVYRQEGSALVAVTSNSDELHQPLANLVELLGESVSNLACVSIERGWLIKVGYSGVITPTSLVDLGMALDATADERHDLKWLANRAADLVNLIEDGGALNDADRDYRSLAADLYRRRGVV